MPWLATRWRINRRGPKLPLQRRHSAIDGALAPARNACESVLGGTTKGGAISWQQRTGETRNQSIWISIVRDWHRDGSALR
jgi:hypothetical protein